MVVGVEGAAGGGLAALLAAPDPLAGAADSVLGASDAAGAEPGSTPASGLAAGPELPPRKSVTYQPEPLSWKPAAVTCLVKASAPQAGQTDSGVSDIFCSTSLAWPQEPHL